MDASLLSVTMASGNSLLEWYCRPGANGAWTTLAQSAFGAYTPCATETLVVSLSNLFLLCLICYRIYIIRKDFKVNSLKRFCLQSRYYNYGLALLAAYNTAEPLFRAVMGLSVVNLDGQASLPPFEGLYVLSNVAAGNEFHKDEIMNFVVAPLQEECIPLIRFLQDMNNSQLRVAEVWCIMNLCYPDSPGVLSRIERLIDAGILSQLQNMTDDPCFDVKDRVKTALEQFMAAEISL